VVVPLEISRPETITPIYGTSSYLDTLFVGAAKAFLAGMSVCPPTKWLVVSKRKP